MGLVLPNAFPGDWGATPVEKALPHWHVGTWPGGSVPLHLWDPRGLRLALEEFQPDIVDLCEEPYSLAAFQSVLLVPNIPLVSHSFQNIAKTLPWPFPVTQRRFFRRVSTIYASCLGVVEVLRHRGFRGPTPIVPLAVEGELLDVRSAGDRIGFIGRLVPEKGIKDLLQFGSRLLCVGDGPMRAELQASGATVRPAGTVVELAQSLSEMAVLVAPSLTTRRWKEQFGRMTIEAMAAGVPVVAYASGAIPEVVGDAGILVPEGDRYLLRQAVARAESNREELSARGRERVCRLFTYQVVAEKMAAIYTAVLDGVPPAPDTELAD